MFTNLAILGAPDCMRSSRAIIYYTLEGDNRTFSDNGLGSIGLVNHTSVPRPQKLLIWIPRQSSKHDRSNSQCFSQKSFQLYRCFRRKKSRYLCCMNPTAGSFIVNQRLQRHFWCCAVPFPEQFLADVGAGWFDVVENAMKKQMRKMGSRKI